ncbi:MAG TPA: S8 family serine peptidase [Gaiellaceae bacterium]|nr:S8 family serine peptidase [Gaiellaceae bacterium]
MKRLALAVFLLALAAPASASAARFAVGLQDGASPRLVARQIEARTGRHVSEIGPFALTVNAVSARGLDSIRGVTWVERLRDSRRLSFTPNDPLVVNHQWYLNRIHAFDAWAQVPSLPSVRVAVIDSGIDASHPELQNQIAVGASFVASSWQSDTNGHGTFVAGEIAAALDNGQGIAGIAFPAQLLVAKVVHNDGTISPDAEAKAIRWAVDHGAKVINLSFGGMRDPDDRTRDTYSPLEAAAIQYAVSNGALVVAAVGNGDGAPSEPWGYAGYPAALPHVVGVSAVARDGSVPSFSNRDVVYNDLAAPGEDIFSTLPRALTLDTRPGCVLQGYSDCGPIEFRRGEGTSFSAPQVSAAAALLLASDPQLQPDQVAALLTGAANDAAPASGCDRCSSGHDPLTGWGVLDVEGAIQSLDGTLPAADHFEANDEASTAARIWGRRGQQIHATIDYWDDQVDVYKIKLRRGQRLVARLRGPRGTDTNLFLWKPGTRRVAGFAVDRRLLAAQSKSPGSLERIRVRAQQSGWYFLEVKAANPGAGRYSLRFRKGPRRAALRAVLP